MTDLLRALVDALAADGEALDRLRDLIGVPPAGEPELWIGVAEAAEHIACKPQRIYNLVNEGRIPHHRDGSRLLFRRSELDDWVRNACHSAGNVAQPSGRAARKRPRP